MVKEFALKDCSEVILPLFRWEKGGPRMEWTFPTVLKSMSEADLLIPE